MLSVGAEPGVGGAVAAAGSTGADGQSSWWRSHYRLHGCSAEELRAWRRERESALRSARRQHQLVSKRHLCEDTFTDEEQIGTNNNEAIAPLSEQEVSQLLSNIQRGTEDRAQSLHRLRWGLCHEESQQYFIRLEGSVRVLIDLFTGDLADLQLEAARCLHELSHSSLPEVVEACLPTTAYLLTYVYGHSITLIELCLYTLGNLAVERKVVEELLLPQGIIPALASCIQSPHVVVQEGAGYVLSQLLQSKDAPSDIIPLVLESTIFQHMLRLVCSNLEDGIGAATECAWGLHYIVCSRVNNSLLISQRTVPSLLQVLLNLASMISTTSAEGMELLVCPVVRCVSNLLAEDEVGSIELLVEEECLLRALFVFIQCFSSKHLFIVQECLWLINNLTADNSLFCFALLNMDLFPCLLKLLCSQMLSMLVLTVLCNIAVQGTVSCQTMHRKGVLPPLISALAFSDSQVASQAMELLHLLFLHWPEAAFDFVAQSGLQALEQHQGNLQVQEQVKALIQTATQLVAHRQD